MDQTVNPCTCEHDFGKHVLFPTDSPFSGIICCPVTDCECVSTWAVQNDEDR